MLCLHSLGDHFRSRVRGRRSRVEGYCNEFNGSEPLSQQKTSVIHHGEAILSESYFGRLLIGYVRRLLGIHVVAYSRCLDEGLSKQKFTFSAQHLGRYACAMNASFLQGNICSSLPIPTLSLLSSSLASLA